MYIYNRKVLKSAAKNDLKGKYWISVLVCLIFEAISYAMGYIHLVANLLVSGPLLFGLAYYFTNILRHNETKIENLFTGFKNYISTFVLGLLHTVFVFLWTLLFIVPGIIKLLAYSMVYYIKRDNPEMTASECLKASIKLTDGHKGKIFMLAFSFIGWYILAGFVIGFASGFINAYAAVQLVQLKTLLLTIALIFVLPYYSMAFARMYDFLILNYNSQHANNAIETIEAKEQTNDVAVEETAEVTAEETAEDITEENPFDL